MCRSIVESGAESHCAVNCISERRYVVMNIGSLLTKTSRLHGNRLAIQYGEQQLTYAELTQRVGRLTGALQTLGVRPGDRVALVQRNGPALFETLFACFRAGAVAVPINVRLHPEEVAFICQDCEARVLVATGEYAASAFQARKQIPELQLVGVESIAGAIDYEALLSAADPVTIDAEVDPDDLAWLFYTSGTTGKPKGAMLTHRNLLAMLMNYFADVYPLTPEDVVLHAAPLTHGSGLFGLPAIAKGATGVILHTPSFDPQTVFTLIQRLRVTTIAFLAPTQIKMLLNRPYQSYDLSSLRCIPYGGGPMYVEDMKQAVEALGPVHFQIYGECEPPNTTSSLRREEHMTHGDPVAERRDRKSTRLNSSHTAISYAVFCLKQKKNLTPLPPRSLRVRRCTEEPKPQLASRIVTGRLKKRALGQLSLMAPRGSGQRSIGGEGV